MLLEVPRSRRPKNNGTAALTFSVAYAAVFKDQQKLFVSCRCGLWPSLHLTPYVAQPVPEVRLRNADFLPPWEMHAEPHGASGYARDVCLLSPHQRICFARPHPASSLLEMEESRGSSLLQILLQSIFIFLSRGKVGGGGECGEKRLKEQAKCTFARGNDGEKNRLLAGNFTWEKRSLFAEFLLKR